MIQDSLKHDFMNENTKMSLGENMYDHLSRIVSRLLETQPPDAVDIVEDLSRQLKYERYGEITIDELFRQVVQQWNASPSVISSMI